VSICIHCGKDHPATSGVCSLAAAYSGTTAQTSQKTMFGVAPAPSVPLPRPAGVRLAATLLAPAGKLPAPAAPIPRLPTEMEVRENPNLVISLDVTPPPSRPAPAKPARNSPSDLPPTFPGSDTTVDLPSVDIPVDLPAPAPDGNETGLPEGTPTDLPPLGSGPRFALPEPAVGAPADPASRSGRQATGSFAERLAADVKSVFDLLGWAFSTYLGKPKPFFLLAAFLVLPASVLQSCLVTGLAHGPASLALGPGIATVDFSTRKAELAALIQESQARGQIDRQAAAELAALTTVETTQVPPGGAEVREGAGWVRERLALFIQGLLLMGLAFPVACGALAIALFDRDSGAALPAFADVWPILLGRGELFLVSLLPAALLVALGNALFVLPGLVLSVLFLFVPHVVLFEKKGGRGALRRSIELATSDATRAVLVFVAFALAGAAVAVFTELLLPTTGSRSLVFLHFVSSDLLTVAVLPIPALALARIYLDLRDRSAAGPERLSRAARS
jgi:hypothetical protein